MDWCPGVLVICRAALAHVRVEGCVVALAVTAIGGSWTRSCSEPQNRLSALGPPHALADRTDN